MPPTLPLHITRGLISTSKRKFLTKFRQGVKVDFVRSLLDFALREAQRPDSLVRPGRGTTSFWDFPSIRREPSSRPLTRQETK